MCAAAAAAAVPLTRAVVFIHADYHDRGSPVAPSTSLAPDITSRRTGSGSAGPPRSVALPLFIFPRGSGLRQRR
ncbi:hypothetical protein ACQRIU_005613 [Beauveria bassiana]